MSVVPHATRVDAAARLRAVELDVATCSGPISAKADCGCVCVHACERLMRTGKGPPHGVHASPFRIGTLQARHSRETIVI